MWVGFVAVGEQRGSTLHVGVYEGFDRGGGIVGDHGEANAAGTRVEIFGVLASRFGLFCVALDDFDSPDCRRFRVRRMYRLRERQFRPDQLRRRLPVVRDPE